MRRCLLSVLVLVALCCANEICRAGERLALVIANSKYGGEAALVNPARDADAIEEALKELAFKVIKKKDLNLDQMRDALVEFNKDLPKGGLGLFYYAGHGVQVQGENFLVPVGAKIRAEFEVKRECLQVEQVLDSMADSESNLKVLVLDCCRNNPFKRSWKRGTADHGLAAIGNVPEGTIVAFSTAAGTAADDGEGKNSPYAEKLVSVLRSRPADGLELVDVFRESSRQVKRATGQVPWLNMEASLEKYYLRPAGDKGGTPLTASTAPSGSKNPATAGTSSSGKTSAGRGGNDWISLLNGRDLSGWVREDGQPAKWKVADGYVESAPGSRSIKTAQEFGPDYELHVEFWLPNMPDKQGQARANSGVFLSGRHEIQILDMVQNSGVGPIKGCGAMYGVLAPNPTEFKPPETWQSFDIVYCSPRYDQAERMTEPGRLTVILNGARLIDDRLFHAPVCPGSLIQTPGTLGPIVLQERGSAVRFRNLKIRPLAAPGTDWKTIFNGTDLTGWKPLGFNGWSVADRVLVGQTGGPTGWLMSDEEYGDYDLEFECRFTSESNSGVFLRSWPVEDLKPGEFVEMQLLDDTAPKYANLAPNKLTGSIYNSVAPDPKPSVAPGVWQRFLIATRGKHVTVMINGGTVLDTDVPTLTRSRGRIGLQLYPTRFEFRNVRVREVQSAGR